MPRSVRRIVFAVATVALAMSTISVLAPSLAQASQFTDIDTSPFKNDIEWLEKTGITTGCSPSQFCPMGTVTRGQMAAFLDRALDLDPTNEDFFTDDESSMFEANINRLAAANITKGCTQTTFCPDATITREQMAAFLDRALDLDSTDQDFFTDDSSSMFEASINRMAAAGITTGCGANKFCPLVVVTREQMAAFLHRALPDAGEPPTASPSPSASATASPSASASASPSASASSSPTASPTPTPTPTPNQAPDAVDDTPVGGVAAECSRLIRALANDSDPEGDGLSIESVTQPLNGTAAIVGSFIRYSSNGTTGADSFTYTISDGELEDSATVSITVNASVGDTDADSINDECDPFATQHANDTDGETTMPSLSFAGADGEIESTGFTGLMTNSIEGSLAQYAASNVGLNGSGLFVVDAVSAGDAVGNSNSQENGFQVAWVPDGENFTVHGRICEPYPPELLNSVGVYLGTGSQEDYIKVVVDINVVGNRAIKDVREVNGVNRGVGMNEVPAIDAADCVDLYIEVSPATDTYLPRYSLDDGATTPTIGGGVGRTVPDAWTDGSQPLAIGIMSTTQGGDPFVASWDLLEITDGP